ncbi:MAG: hypothetical protein PVF83_18550 [Anaerolineales bacterium]
MNEIREKVNLRSKRKLLMFFILIFSFGCKLLPHNSPTPNIDPSQTASMIQNQQPVNTQIFTSVVSPNIQLEDFVLSKNAGDYVGEVITIKIEIAYCSYRPDVNGAPTFCNDQPFPNHTFTLITWGKDWTDLDGECLYVKGEVEEYEGKYEIIADHRDQVSFCD